MATSNTYSWNATVQEIISRSLRIVGATPAGQTPNTSAVDNAKFTLNNIVKRITVDGLRLWQLEEVILPIPTSSSVVGSDGLFYFANKNHTSVQGLSGNQPIVNTNWNDYWSIGADSTTTQWVSGSNYTASNILSLDSKYVGVSTAFYRYNNIDYPLDIISFGDYFAIEDKFSRSSTVPVSLSYDETSRNIFIYPYPINATGRVHILAVRYLQDISNNSENVDFPVEWFDALTYMLAASLADEYGVDLSTRGFILSKADKLYETAKGTNRSSKSPFVNPFFNATRKY